MRTTCIRKLAFCAGHRVMGHEGKCAHLHGHEYLVEVEVAAPELDGVGRVVDFSAVKARVGEWLDDNWDHGLLLHSADEPGRRAAAVFEEWERGRTRKPFSQKLYLLPYNPTAENLARHLAETVIPAVLLQATELELVSVKVHETPNCSALVTGR